MTRDHHSRFIHKLESRTCLQSVSGVRFPKTDQRGDSMVLRDPPNWSPHCSGQVVSRRNKISDGSPEPSHYST